MGENDRVYVSQRHGSWHRPGPVKTHRKRRPFVAISAGIIFAFIILYGIIFLSPQFTGPSITSAKDSINGIIAAHPDYDIGVSLVNSKTSDTLDLGTQSSFTAASTTKMLTAILALHEVEQGSLSATKTFNDFPLTWHLKQIVNQSNDDSWVTLNHYFGQKRMENYAKSIGITSYRYNGNNIAPHDMALLLNKLYSGSLLNEAHTKQLLGYMQNTNNDSLIPAIADTTDITVYHKYGWYGSYIHDAAILKDTRSTWVLAIYTHPKNDQNNADTSTDIIHSITKATIDAMES